MKYAFSGVVINDRFTSGSSQIGDIMTVVPFRQRFGKVFGESDRQDFYCIKVFCEYEKLLELLTNPSPVFANVPVKPFRRVDVDMLKNHQGVINLDVITKALI